MWTPTQSQNLWPTICPTCKICYQWWPRACGSREMMSSGHGPLNQLNKVHMDSQRWKQEVQGLQGSTPSHLHHIIAISSVFNELLTMRTSAFLTLVPALETLSPILFCLTLTWKFLFHFIMFYFCHVWLLPLGRMFFSNKRQKGSRWRWERRWGWTGRSRGERKQ